MKEKQNLSSFIEYSKLTAFEPNNPLTIECQIRKYQQIIKDLESLLKEEMHKNKQMSEEIKQLNERTSFREKEYQRILADYIPDVYKFVHESTRAKDPKTTEVFHTFKEIIDNFEKSNQATNKFIENRYQESMKKMENRINTITKVFEKEFTDYKNSTKVDLGPIMKEVKYTIEFAKGLEGQLFDLRDELIKEKRKVEFLESEKSILIEEMVEKKNVISKLYLQIKRFQEQDKNFNNKSYVEVSNTECDLINEEKINQKKFSQCLRFSKYRLKNIRNHKECSLETSINSNRGMSIDHKIRGNSNESSFAIKSLSKSLKGSEKNEIKLESKMQESLKKSLSREKKKNKDLERTLSVVLRNKSETNEILKYLAKEMKYFEADGQKEGAKSNEIVSKIKAVLKRVQFEEKEGITIWEPSTMHTNYYDIHETEYKEEEKKSRENSERNRFESKSNSTKLLKKENKIIMKMQTEGEPYQYFKSQ